MFNKVRKISTFTLALFFLGVSTGFTVNMHFCKDKLAGISFMGEELSCGMHQGCQSSQCDMMKKTTSSHCQTNDSHCCSNKHLVIKLDAKKIVSYNFSYQISPDVAVINLLTDDLSQDVTLKEKKSFDESPPNSYHPPPFILFHQLLFYH